MREEKNRNKILKVGKQITPGPKELNPKLAAKDPGNHSNLRHKISQKFEEFVALGPSGSERRGGWNKDESFRFVKNTTVFKHKDLEAETGEQQHTQSRNQEILHGMCKEMHSHVYSFSTCASHFKLTYQKIKSSHKPCRAYYLVREYLSLFQLQCVLLCSA